MAKKKIVTRLGTKNQAAVALGRLGGIAKSGHRISAESVRFIRKTKRSARELADLYNVHLSTIYHIRERRTWTWVS